MEQNKKPKQTQTSIVNCSLTQEQRLFNRERMVFMKHGTRTSGHLYTKQYFKYIHPTLWPPDAKNWFIGKDSEAGKVWSQEEKGMTEDEMVGWHHWLDGHEFEHTLGVGDGQGSPVASVHGVAKSWTWLNDWTELISSNESRYKLNSKQAIHKNIKGKTIELLEDSIGQM